MAIHITEGDSRLSDARTPASHSHGPTDVTGTAVVTGDSRLSDARIPTAHDNTKHSTAYLSDAPSDGKTYGRKNAAWTEPPAGGSPPTGTGWRHVTNGVEDAAATIPTASDVGADASGLAATVQDNLTTHTGLTTTAHGEIVANTDVRLSDARQLAAGTDKTKLDGIEYGANVGVVPNAAIAGATKTKITYDAKGLVTVGADAVAADVGAEVAGAVAGHKDLATGVHGAGANTLIYSNEPKLTDARTPLAHKASHIGGADQLDDATITVHGLLLAADKVKLNATIGTNTGDQTLAGLGGIAHSLATALNDFLCASGVGSFVKKTLAEVLTILGKAVASGLASLDASSRLVQLRARGDDGMLYTVLANDTLAQAFGTNSVTRLTVTAARTLTTTVPPAGCTATLIILTSGTSAWVITFGTGFKSVGTLSTGTVSARKFAISFISDGTNLIETGRTIAMAS